MMLDALPAPLDSFGGIGPSETDIIITTTSFDVKTLEAISQLLKEMSFPSVFTRVSNAIVFVQRVILNQVCLIAMICLTTVAVTESSPATGKPLIMKNGPKSSVLNIALLIFGWK